MDEWYLEHRNHIGFQVNSLAHLLKRYMNQIAPVSEDAPVTGMQGWIIGYLYDNRDRDVFQRDLQAHFSVRRSTVTGILQLMEKNGLIVRKTVEHDARLKKLELTPAAVEQHERFHRNIREAEARISEGLSEQERETFVALCEKLRAHIESIEN